MNYFKVIVFWALFCGAQTGASAALLSYWNFNNESTAYSSPSLGSLNTSANLIFGETYNQVNNSTAGTLSSNTANGTIFNGAGINIDFSNFGTIDSATINGKVGPGYTTQNSTAGNAGYGIFLDSTVNRAVSDSTTGGSLLLLNTGGNAIGKYLTFSLSSAGYDSLSLSYSTRLTNTVAASQVWTYSIDGTNFFTLATISPTANGTFISQSLDLSSLSSNALDDQSSFYLRMTYNSPNAQGSQAFDNFQLTGLAMVPEPSIYVLLGLGLFTLVFLNWKNIQKFGS